MIHCLLALTTVLSAGQILALSILIWFKESKKFKDYMVLTILPLGICFFYIKATTTLGVFQYHIVDLWTLIDQAFALDRLLLLLILGSIYWFSRQVGHFKPKGMENHSKEMMFYGLSNLVVCSILLIYFKCIEVPNRSVLPLDSRYLIFLTPIEIMATVFFIVRLFRFLRNNQAGLWIGQFISLVTFFYLIHFLLVYKEIYSAALFAYIE